MSYYVYILICKDGSYYTGHAKDVERRVERHKKGQGARYTTSHKPERIVFLEKFVNRSAAMKREREIKSLNHSKKQQLINSQDKTNLANSVATRVRDSRSHNSENMQTASPKRNEINAFKSCDDYGNGKLEVVEWAKKRSKAKKN